MHTEWSSLHVSPSLLLDLRHYFVDTRDIVHSSLSSPQAKIGFDDLHNCICNAVYGTSKCGGKTVDMQFLCLHFSRVICGSADAFAHIDVLNSIDSTASCVG